MKAFVQFERNKHFPQVLNPKNWFWGGGFSCWSLKKDHITLNEGGYPVNFTARWKDGENGHSSFVILFFFGLRAGWFK